MSVILYTQMKARVYYFTYYSVRQRKIEEWYANQIKHAKRFHICHRERNDYLNLKLELDNSVFETNIKPSFALR